MFSGPLAQMTINQTKYSLITNTPCSIKNRHAHGYFTNKSLNPFYPEYDSSRSYPFYPEYDSGRSLHLARLPRTLTFWNPIGWLTPNDVSISGSLGNPYFSTNQCHSLGICRTNRAPPSQSEIKDGVESQRSLNVDVFRRITPLIYFILLMTRRQTSG